MFDPTTIAQFLDSHPDFFLEHPGLLAKMRLPSPVQGRAVSLQERQIEILREQYRVLELQMTELVQIAQSNDALAEKFYVWACALLLARNDVDLPHTLINGLQTIFAVPYVSLRIWRVAEDYAHTWFAEDVSENVNFFANSLTAPYCGANRDFEAVQWLEAKDDLQSIAMLPLRNSDSPDAFGLLIMGSPEAQRFAANMATDFLMKIGETASAALSCLLD
jgi:uncharacterized protein YigA (DUF484 family)